MSSFLKSFLGFGVITIYIIITLYPPFNWTVNNPKWKSRIESIYDAQIPIKNNDFIFNPTIKKYQFHDWRWNYNNNISEKYTKWIPLQRSIIISELVLNYLLTFFTFYLIYRIFETLKKIKTKFLRVK